MKYEAEEAYFVNLKNYSLITKSFQKKKPIFFEFEINFKKGKGKPCFKDQTF